MPAPLERAVSLLFLSNGGKGQSSTLTFSLRSSGSFAGLHVAGDVIDDHAGDVLTGGFLDAFQAGGAVHLHHDGAILGAQEVDSRHAKSHDAGRVDGGGTFLCGQFFQSSAPTTMKVGAKFALGTLSLHGGDDLVSNHQTTDVSSASFFDELLHEDVRVQATEGFDDGFSGLGGLREYDSDSLGAFQELDDERGAAANFDEAVSLPWCRGQRR